MDWDSSNASADSPVAQIDRGVPFTNQAGRSRPFDSLHTTQLDDLFRASCFKNAVCTITTNLRLNMSAFTNRIGGQLTSSLPGNRLILVLSGHRYSVICCQTGKFVLTNLFFFNRLKDIYDYFINFCLMLIKQGIARVCGEAINGRRQFKILFMLENCQFSFRFKESFFQTAYAASRTPDLAGLALTSNALVHKHPPKRVLLELVDFLVEHMTRLGHCVESSTCRELGCQEKAEAFPADLIKLAVLRDGTILSTYKSAASTKRNKNKFNTQNISLLIFNKGKIIVTGMQTRADIEPIFDAMKAVVHFFLRK